jgi:adenosylcobinamide kinase / adenosylcobinamide-phosphate guanylyltransferase
LSVRVPDGLTFLLGGARSGKSALAVRLGESFDGPVTYVATATAGDDDMAARIARHRTERPSQWATIESPLLDVALPAHGLLIIDCLTLWATNLMLAGSDDESTLAAARSLSASWAKRSGPTLVISNEVGLGVVPTTDLGRSFRDLLGRVNATIASAASRSYLVVAGQLLQLQVSEEVFS